MIVLVFHAVSALVNAEPYASSARFVRATDYSFSAIFLIFGLTSVYVHLNSIRCPPSSVQLAAGPLAWLKCAVKIGNQECNGLSPGPPHSTNNHYPNCSGRSITNGALGTLLLSGGNNTEEALTMLQKVGPDSTFSGQAWPAIWLSSYPSARLCPSSPLITFADDH